MINNIPAGDESCLGDNELYSYIARQGGAEKLKAAESHLAECDFCRKSLADLLALIAPDQEQQTEAAELTREELDRTLSLIRETARNERSGKSWFRRRVQWPMAAAAAIGFIALCLTGMKYLQEQRKSGQFYSQARAMLEQNYTGTSPGNLRLSLPFKSTAVNRSHPESESLDMAENLFFQALAVKEDMLEARLGLGFIYLNESKYSRARDEFQKVLDAEKDHNQALLGRGVAQYEEALEADPLRRDALLKGAIRDFDAVLARDSNSAEARYNKVWALFESGLHRQALEEIEIYLSRDADSGWAEGLKGLRTRMKATQTGAVEDEVNRAARERDRAALVELSRQAPYQMPAAIWSAMRRGLSLEEQGEKHGGPTSSDLYWAAGIMESGYRAATGDVSFKAFIDFFNGLSPPERQTKRSLDREFQSLVQLHQKGEFDLTLRNSKTLESRYANIKDLWQLVNLHHLRGMSYYMGEADFCAAEFEFRKMHEIALQLNAPDLMAKALGALSMILSMQSKSDESLSCAYDLRDIALKYKLQSWQTYSGVALGHQFRRTGQFQHALQEYGAALAIAYRLLDNLRIVEGLEYSGMAMESLGRFDEADDFYELAIRYQDSHSDEWTGRPEFKVRRLNSLLKKGHLALKIGDLSKAKLLFERSLESAPSGMRELRARNHIGLAEIYLLSGQIREAKTSLDQVMSDDLGQYPEIEWQAEFLRGRLYETSGNPIRALSSYSQSIEVLEKIRNKVTAGDFRNSFFIERYDPFKAATDLLFDSSQDRYSLIDFIDRSKSATLKENLNENHRKAGDFHPPGFFEEQAFTTLEYFFTRERLLAVVTSQGKTKAAAINISSQEMTRKVDSFLQAIRNSGRESFEKAARQLYVELLGPVEDSAFARRPEPLVIIPDGPLYLLPFAALQDRNGKFLVEKAPVAFAPSRSVFRHCLALSRKKHPAGGDMLLLDGSAGLPNARNELAYIADLFRNNASILSAKDMPVSAGRLRQADILHFSGHAVVHQGQPVLVVQRHPKEILLDCSTIRRWKMPRTELVNLAGCSTGIGPIAEGESPWGLVPAFLDAGAPAILASLMDVDDAATGRLSCRFYDRLKEGSSKSEALQLAQLDLLRSYRSNPATKAYTWVPYVLVGNPR